MSAKQEPNPYRRTLMQADTDELERWAEREMADLQRLPVFLDDESLIPPEKPISDDDQATVDDYCRRWEKLLAERSSLQHLSTRSKNKTERLKYGRELRLIDVSIATYIRSAKCSGKKLSQWERYFRETEALEHLDVLTDILDIMKKGRLPRRCRSGVGRAAALEYARSGKVLRELLVFLDSDFCEMEVLRPILEEARTTKGQRNPAIEAFVKVTSRWDKITIAESYYPNSIRSTHRLIRRYKSYRAKIRAKPRWKTLVPENVK